LGIIAEQSVRLTWPQEQTTPGGGYYQLYRDGSADTENESPIPAWPDGHGKSGWGRGRRGRGRWGKSSGGLGWGMGRRGRGGWGRGGQNLSIDTEPIGDGLHSWEIFAYDGPGNESSSAASGSVAVRGEPDAPRAAVPSSYDGTALVIAFTLSRDDEAA